MKCVLSMLRVGQREKTNSSLTFSYKILIKILLCNNYYLIIYGLNNYRMMLKYYENLTGPQLKLNRSRNVAIGL